MSFPTELIGDDLSKYGEKKWECGVLSEHDGCIYAGPHGARHILKIDPNNDTTNVVESEKFEGLSGKYIGGASFNDWIYFVPNGANQVMKFNVTTQTVELIGKSYHDVKVGTKNSENKWGNGAVGYDGCMYCAPHDARNILKVNPNDDSTELVGEKLEDQPKKFYDAIPSEDKKKIYFIPSRSEYILIYDIVAETSERISIGHLKLGGPLKEKWRTGSLVNGCIYAIPDKGVKILKYNPSEEINSEKIPKGYNPFKPENPTLVGDSFGNGGNKWNGSVSEGNYIYGIPAEEDKVLRYDTERNETTHVGNSYPGIKKYHSGVRADNGCIYAIPFNYHKVLKINPLRIADNVVPETTYQTSVGIVDSPKGGDKLEHCQYAEALVKHITSMERNNKAISVGLFGPWGSGKTFFWKLIQKEFKKLEKSPHKQEKNLCRSIKAACRSAKADDCCCRSVNADDCCGTIAVYMIWERILKVLLFLFKSFCCCYHIGMSEDPDKDETTHIDMDFDTWTYRRSQDIWASMLDKMWERVQEELEGKKGFDIKWHRAGIERADTKESDTREDKLKKEKLARKKLEIKLNVSITLFVWTVTFWILIFALSPIFLEAGNNNSTTQNPTTTLSPSPSPTPNDDNSDDNIASNLATSARAIYGYVFLAVSIFASALNLVIELLNYQKDIKFGFEKINKEIDSYERRDFAKDFGIMGIVEKEVNHLFDFLRAHNARIRLFVDDLDRLDRQKSMDVLWVVSLLFGTSDAPVTSFLAVDTKIIVDYIVEEFKNINGFRFLEKIINLPFSIPEIEPEGKKKFFGQLVDKLQITQIYQKALEHKNDPNCSFASIVADMKDNVFNNGTEEDMLDDLIDMGRKMDGHVGMLNAMLNPIGQDLLNAEQNNSSRIDELLLALRTNIDNLEMLQITQIYQKALEHKNDPNCSFPGVVVDMEEDVFNSGTEKDMLDGLIKMGRKMNGHLGAGLNLIGQDLLNAEQNNSSQIGELLQALGTNIYILSGEPNYPQVPHLKAPNAHQASKSKLPLYNSITVQEERLFIDKYAQFIDGVPRKMIRILNVYNVSRSFAFIKGDAAEIDDPDFLEHLFVFTVLQELCPYRTSWLLYISRCAAELLKEKTGESKSFNYFLRKLEEEDQCHVLDLSVTRVYTRIVCEVLHCLSNADKHLTADVGVMHFETLLSASSLTLNDFETLRKYAFNLPRSMISDIKMYRNDCVIDVKEFPDDNDRDYKWVATFHRINPANGRKET